MKKVHRGGAATTAPTLGIIAAKRHKNTKTPAQIARAPIGAMETPATTFEILCLLVAAAAGKQAGSPTEVSRN